MRGDRAKQALIMELGDVHKNINILLFRLRLAGKRWPLSPSPGPRFLHSLAVLGTESFPSSFPFLLAGWRRSVAHIGAFRGISPPVGKKSYIFMDVPSSFSPRAEGRVE